MKTIQRYKINVGENKIEMPKDAKILCVNNSVVENEDDEVSEPKKEKEEKKEETEYEKNHNRILKNMGGWANISEGADTINPIIIGRRSNSENNENNSKYHDEMSLYAEIDTDSKNLVRKFMVFGSGEDMSVLDKFISAYIGTVFETKEGKTIEYHIYEISSKK